MTDPTDETLKSTVERLGWIKVLLAFVVAVFVLGGSTFALVAKVPTKDDLKTEVRAAKSELSGEIKAQSARTDELERWRAASDARRESESWWVRTALSDLMRDRGLRPPAEPPPPTISTVPTSIGPLR